MKFPGLEDELLIQLLLTAGQIEGEPFSKVDALLRARQAGGVVKRSDLLAALKEAAKAGGWYSDKMPFGTQGTFQYLKVASQLDDPEAALEIGKLAAMGIVKIMPQEAAGPFFELAVDLAARPSTVYSEAKRNLARALETGIGVEKRDDRAAFEAWKAYAASLSWSYSNDPDIKKRGPQHGLARAMGDLSFDDAGSNFIYPEEPWGVSRIWWKKAVGARQAYDPRILFEDMPAGGVYGDKDAAAAFRQLAYLSYYGLGVVQSQATAFTLWRWTAHTDMLSRKYALDVLLQYRERAEAIEDEDLKTTARRVRDRYIQSFKECYPILDGEFEDAAIIWAQAIDDPPSTRKGRTELYQRLAGLSDWKGTVALTLIETLFGRASEQQVASLLAAADRTQQVPAPIVRLFRDRERVARVKSALEPIRLALNEENLKLYLDGPKAPRALIEAAAANRIQPTIEVLEWCDLRSYLAEIAQEGSAGLWEELNVRLQIRSPTLLAWVNQDARTKDLLSAMPDVVRNMTKDIGPVLNEVDKDGFPIPMTRARIGKSLLDWGMDKGWERVDQITLTQDGFEVLGEKTDKGYTPIVTRRDIEEVLAIALVEIPSRPALSDRGANDDIAFSLERLKGAHEAPVRLRFFRREISGAEWINGTGFGRAKYYTDCLLFISEVGNTVFSTSDPFITRQTHRVGWYHPEPWRRARAGGGVSGSTVIRNAGVTRRGVPGDGPLPPPAFPYRIELPRVLRQIDGSEIVFDKDGKELHRDGGIELITNEDGSTARLGSLHYHSIRHASILSSEVPLMAEQFPVFERTMQLERVYSGLRMSIGNDIDWIRSSKLYRRLEKVRDKAIANWEKNGHSAGVVIAH